MPKEILTDEPLNKYNKEELADDFILSDEEKNRIYSEAQEKWKKIISPMYKEIERFCRYLEDKYTGPYCRECEMYQLLIGSGVPKGCVLKHFDLPSEDSVENFINKKYTELGSTKNY